MDARMKIAEIISPPWDDETVSRLNEFQCCGVFHPFTCGNGCREWPLLATRNGWVCKTCDYTQDWAHGSMASAGLAAAAKWQKDFLASFWPAPPADSSERGE